MRTVKAIAIFVIIGLVFLSLFLPYIVWVQAEARMRRGTMTEGQLINRLAGMALKDMFHTVE